MAYTDPYLFWGFPPEGAMPPDPFVGMMPPSPFVGMMPFVPPMGGYLDLIQQWMQQAQQQYASALALEQMLAQSQLGLQQDYLRFIQDMERARMMGAWEGVPTLEARIFDTLRNLEIARMMGEWEGRPTLEARIFDTLRALEIARMLGEWEGKPTLERQLMEINRDLTSRWLENQRRLAIAELLGVPVSPATAQFLTAPEASFTTLPWYQVRR